MRALRRCVVAEFCKISAFRIPYVAYPCIFVFLGVFAFQLFYIEGISKEIGSSSVTDAMPYLFFSSWRTLLFQIFATVFSAYCVAVDSQYGMIRVACVQPVSRIQYIAGKSLAIVLHIVLFASWYVISVFVWTAIGQEKFDLSIKSLLVISSLTARTVVFCIGLSGCVIAVSMIRKTLLGAVVSSFVLFVCFGLLTTLPTRYHLEPVLFVRYLFYPVAGILPSGWPMPFPMQGAPLWQFLLVSLTTPLVCCAPALPYFCVRDIVE